MECKTLPPDLLDALRAYLEAERMPVGVVEVVVLPKTSPRPAAPALRPTWTARLYLTEGMGA